MEFVQLAGGRLAAVHSPHPIFCRTYVYAGQNQRAALRMFSMRCMYYESLSKIERQYRACQRTNVFTRAGGSSGRDLLTQWDSSMRKPLDFFLMKADTS